MQLGNLEHFSFLRADTWTVWSSAPWGLVLLAVMLLKKADKHIRFEAEIRHFFLSPPLPLMLCYSLKSPWFPLQLQTHSPGLSTKAVASLIRTSDFHLQLAQDQVFQLLNKTKGWNFNVRFAMQKQNLPAAPAGELPASRIFYVNGNSRQR